MNQPIHWVKSTHYDELNKQPNVFCPILTQFFRVYEFMCENLPQSVN